MKFTFENQGTNTYLVYEVGTEDTIDTMSLGMLTNNKILGLAPTQFTQVDTTKYIKYNVSAHISVRQFFSGAVNKKRLLGVFKGIVNAMLSAEEYMIDTRSILVDIDYIFADVSTCDTVLVCLPIVEVEKNQVDLGSFFKSIMFTTQFDSTENCDYVANIINYLNSAPVFSITDFKSVLDNIDVAPQGVRPMQTQRPQPVVGQAPVQQQPVQQSVQQPGPQPAPVQQPPQNPPMANNANKVPVPPAQKPQVPPAGNMAVPGQMPGAQPAAANTANNGKDMSWLYLMQHYNKENAAAYKAQKEARKNGSKAPAPAPMPGAPMPGAPMPNVPPQGMGVPVPPKNNGFAVPGQPAAPVAPKQPMQQPPQGMARPQAPGQMAPQGMPAQAPGQMPPQGMPRPQAPGQMAPQGMPRPQAPGQMPPQGMPAQAPGQMAPQGMPTQAPGQMSPQGMPAQAPGQMPPQGMPAQAPGQMAPQSMPAQAPQAPRQMPPQAPQGQAMSFGETTVLGSGKVVGETTVLSGAATAAQSIPYLVRAKTNEKIQLSKPVFRIGKEKSYVDYFIGDNTAISRSHANIISRDGDFFAVDTNSTNHTYVNGMMLQSNVETKLKHGDKLRLANEEFEFRVF